MFGKFAKGLSFQMLKLQMVSFFPRFATLLIKHTVTHSAD